MSGNDKLHEPCETMIEKKYHSDKGFNNHPFSEPSTESAEAAVNSEASQIDIVVDDMDNLSVNSANYESSEPFYSSSVQEFNTSITVPEATVQKITVDADKPGHINNLTYVQLKQLYQLWNNLFDSLDAILMPQKSSGSIRKKSSLKSSRSQSSTTSLTLSNETGLNRSKLGDADKNISSASIATSTTSSESATGKKKGFWPFKFTKKSESTSSIEGLNDKEMASTNAILSDDFNTSESKVDSFAETGITDQDSYKTGDVANDPKRSDPSLLSAENELHNELEESPKSQARVGSLSMPSTSSLRSQLSDATSTAMIDSENELWRGFLVGHCDPDVTILRFLRARKWNLAAATNMLLATSEWRSKSGIFHTVQGGEILLARNLLESGKTYFHGIDKQGRTIIYVLARKHFKSANTLEENEKFTVYNMEIARSLLANGTETVCLIFDMTGFTLANMDFPSIKFLVNCFQNYYPESLGQCYIVNSPWIFWTFWKLIKPLLDPVVTAKILFVKMEDLQLYIDKDMLVASMGGSNKYEYKYIPPSESTDAKSDDNQLSNHLKVNGGEISSSLLARSDSPSGRSSLSTDQAELTASCLDSFIRVKTDLINITREIHTKLTSFSTEEEIASCVNDNVELFEKRNTLKAELLTVSNQLDRMTLPECYYHRLGIIDTDTGSVNWKRFKDVS